MWEEGGLPTNQAEESNPVDTLTPPSSAPKLIQVVKKKANIYLTNTSNMGADTKNYTGKY